MNRRNFMQAAMGSAAGIAMPQVLAQKKPSASATAAAPAVPFVLKGVDVQGRSIDLQNYAGKACLISFFTADCIRCDNDLRLMREFYGANKVRNFVNIAVNMDGEKSVLVDYVDLMNKTIPANQHFPIIWRKAKGHVDNFGAITSEPTHFVLNKEHRLLLRRDGTFKPNDWDDLWTMLG